MEPAVKPAIEATNSGEVAVIATEATFQGHLFDSLLERYARGVDVITQVCPGLVDAVEAGAFDTPEVRALLERCLEPLLAAGADQLVLACTHYPLAWPAIEAIVGEAMSIIDPAPAVARQTGRVLARRGVEAAKDRRGRHRLFTSADPARFSEMVDLLVPASGRQPQIRRVLWRGARLEVDCSRP